MCVCGVSRRYREVETGRADRDTGGETMTSKL